MTPEAVESLGRATLAAGLIQLATHFPTELEGLGMTQEEALEQAFFLAEEAIALDPEQADGHVALGRLLLVHDTDEARKDAIEILEHALSLDAEHDGAQIALATALWEEGNNQEAMNAVDAVIKRGSGRPQPLVLRALLNLDQGNSESARKDLERAIRITPKLGLFHLDAAAIARSRGDKDEEQFHDDEARELLGKAYESLKQAFLKSEA
ncbi:tetratricopeptide repeat protein [Myxococcota bacterium]|nr:tetratricopeptide repeat protein [Myxococcota bacterium]